MKKCDNCSCLYPDDYEGSCSDCGRGMANSGGKTLGDPNMALANQAMRVRQDARRDQQIAAKDHKNMRFDESDPVFEMAKEFVLDFRTPEQKARDEEYGI